MINWATTNTWGKERQGNVTLLRKRITDVRFAIEDRLCTFGMICFYENVVPD